MRPSLAVLALLGVATAQDLPTNPGFGGSVT